MINDALTPRQETGGRILSVILVRIFLSYRCASTARQGRPGYRSWWQRRGTCLGCAWRRSGASYVCVVEELQRLVTLLVTVSIGRLTCKAIHATCLVARGYHAHACRNHISSSSSLLLLLRHPSLTYLCLITFQQRIIVTLYSRALQHTESSRPGRPRTQFLIIAESWAMA